MTDVVYEVLKYCSDDFNFIVFRCGEENDAEPEFWTLEKTEEDAKNRVRNETDGYGDVPEFQFMYHVLKRVERNYLHLSSPRIETVIDYGI